MTLFAYVIAMACCRCLGCHGHDGTGKEIDRDHDDRVRVSDQACGDREMASGLRDGNCDLEK